ncbi:acyl-CoA desaturase-like [Oppia nitens]|uniref:acyl-CoA desaturase-like n=1 Tax=Oppia nitens TaxID=1686743 RepID=UPI0023D9E8CC|nr:acyl-CoA desaturase-like [Oppia nitens]
MTELDKRSKYSDDMSNEHDDLSTEHGHISNEHGDTPTVKYQMELVWRNIILMLFVHLSAIYGLYLAMFYAKLETVVFMLILALMSSFGVQCGAHRLWCHRTYKAKLPLQIILAVFHILALENDIYEWSRDHRVHHKYSETDADPHNAKRGFFFAHVGWLLCKKHPEVLEKGKTVDMSDLENDPLIQFQRTFYIPLIGLIWGFLPTYIPYLLWGETLWISYFTCIMLRYAFTLNVTWCVNSAAHLWGTKPYDKSINPVECVIRHIMFGEGFHNYHHTFPWDYSASEFGAWRVFNPATLFIDMFALIGWAYDLKKPSKEVINNRMKRSGDFNYKSMPFIHEVISSMATLLCIISPFILGFWIRKFNK